jgi:hypothetical protein
MTASEALTLSTRLFGFFPAGTQPETIELYAAKLTKYDARTAAKAINRIIEHRTDRFPPAWAEVLDEIHDQTPKRSELEAGHEQIGVPPTREFHEARRILSQKTAARNAEFTSRPRLALGSPVRSGDYVKIIEREGRILWDYTLSGNAEHDAAELRWGADQCGLAAIDMANVMPRLAPIPDRADSLPKR